jgi:hypothetical protein
VCTIAKKETWNFDNIDQCFVYAILKSPVFPWQHSCQASEEICCLSWEIGEAQRPEIGNLSQFGLIHWRRWAIPFNVHIPPPPPTPPPLGWNFLNGDTKFVSVRFRGKTVARNKNLLQGIIGFGRAILEGTPRTRLQFWKLRAGDLLHAVQNCIRAPELKGASFAPGTVKPVGILWSSWLFWWVRGNLQISEGVLCQHLSWGLKLYWPCR